MKPEWTPWFKLDRMIEDSLIGTAEEVRDKVLRLEAELQLRSLLRGPAGGSIGMALCAIHPQLR